jgi:outer membrane protein assembly factor BamB
MVKRAAVVIAAATLFVLAFTLLSGRQPQILWRLEDPGYSWLSSPAIGTGGILYSGDYLGNLRAFSATGDLLWETNLCSKAAPRAGFEFLGDPAIGPDGSIYVISGDGRLSAVSSKGELRWERAIGAMALNGVTINADGTIYASSTSNCLHALTAEGIERWCFRTDGRIIGRTIVDQNGNLYFSCNDSNFYTIDRYGDLRWKQHTQGTPAQSLLGSDGVIYVSAYPTLKALNTDGSLKWVVTNAHVTSVMVLDRERRLYCETFDGLSAFDADTGQLRWHRNLRGLSQQDSALARDGCIYVCSDESTVYAIESSTGDIRWAFTRRSVPALLLHLERAIEWIDFARSGFTRYSRAAYPCSLTLSEEGLLYAMMPDQHMYALKVEAGLATNAPWPMSYGNVRRTGARR